MALSDLSKPTYINRLTSLDPKNPLSWVSIILALVGIAIVALMLLLPDMEDATRLALAVALFVIIWVETYLMCHIQAAQHDAADGDLQ